MAIKNEPLGDQLARQLRNDILSGKRASGDVLIEKALSEEFGLSRGPVRDAFQQLEQDGLIEADGRSFHVAPFDAHDITEIYHLRIALEQLAVERALAAEADWSGSHRAVAAMKQAVLAGDSAQFVLADLAFHTSLFEATSQRRLLGASRTVERTLAALMELMPALHDDLRSMMLEHEQILESIESGSDEWRSLLVRHLELGCEMLCSAFSFHSGREAEQH